VPTALFAAQPCSGRLPGHKLRSFLFLWASTEKVTRNLSEFPTAVECKRGTHHHEPALSHTYRLLKPFPSTNHAVPGVLSASRSLFANPRGASHTPPRAPQACLCVGPSNPHVETPTHVPQLKPPLVWLALFRGASPCLCFACSVAGWVTGLLALVSYVASGRTRLQRASEQERRTEKLSKQQGS